MEKCKPAPLIAHARISRNPTLRGCAHLPILRDQGFFHDTTLIPIYFCICNVSRVENNIDLRMGGGVKSGREVMTLLVSAPFFLQVLLGLGGRWPRQKQVEVRYLRFHRLVLYAVFRCGSPAGKSAKVPPL